MQKNTMLLFAGIFASSLVLSCDMQMPESLSVKTGAKFEVPLGTAKYDVTESVSSETLIEKVQDAMGDKASLYEFIPADDADVLSYLIRYPVSTVPIDIGEYLEGLDLKSALNGDGSDNEKGLGEAFSFSAGEPLKKTVSQNISLGDVSSKINESVKLDNAEAKIEELPEISGDSDTNAQIKSYLPTITVKNNSDSIQYSRVYYEAGEIKLSVTRTDTNAVTNGYSLSVLATLVDTTGKELSSTNNGSYTNITNANSTELSLPLTAQEGLPPEFKILIKAKAEGGSGTAQHTFTIKPTIANQKLSKIVGLTASASDLGIDAKTINETISSLYILSIFLKMMLIRRKRFIIIRVIKIVIYNNKSIIF